MAAHKTDVQSVYVWSMKKIETTIFTDDISVIGQFLPKTGTPHTVVALLVLYCWIFSVVAACSPIWLTFIFSSFFQFLVYFRYQMRKREIESCNDNGTTMTTTTNNTNPILTNSTTTQTTQTTTCGYTNTITMVSICGRMNSMPRRIDPLSNKRVFTRTESEKKNSHKLQPFCSDFYCEPFGFY